MVGELRSHIPHGQKKKKKIKKETWRVWKMNKLVLSKLSDFIIRAKELIPVFYDPIIWLLYFL